MGEDARTIAAAIAAAGQLTEGAALLRALDGIDGLPQWSALADGERDLLCTRIAALMQQADALMRQPQAPATAA